MLESECWIALENESEHKSIWSEVARQNKWTCRIGRFTEAQANRTNRTPDTKTNEFLINVDALPVFYTQDYREHTSYIFLSPYFENISLFRVLFFPTLLNTCKLEKLRQNVKPHHKMNIIYSHNVCAFGIPGQINLNLKILPRQWSLHTRKLTHMYRRNPSTHTRALNVVKKVCKTTASNTHT